MQSNSHGIPGHITIEPRIMEIYGQADGENEQTGPGHDIRVTIIQGGASKNGFVYDDAALRSIAKMVEGARAYADHSGGNEATRSVRDIVGFYQDAIFVTSEGAQASSVEATLHLFESAGWLWSIIQEASTLGRPELIGLSIDIFGQWQRNEAEQTRTVTRVVSLNSCDIVTRPSAGGAFRRILHDEQTIQNEADASQVVHEFSSKGTTMQQEPIQEQQSMTEQQALLPVSEMQQMLAELRLQRAELLLERRLQESILPGVVKAPIRARFQGRIFEESELERGAGYDGAVDA